MSDSQDLMLRARFLLRRVPLIDGHNDFPFMIRGLYSNQLSNDSLQNFPIGQTDITRLRRGLVGGQFWSAYVPRPKQPDASSLDEPSPECLRQTLQQIDVIHRMIERYPTVFALAVSSEDVWSVFRSGRIASLIGIEGLHQIASSPSVLRMLYRLGVRYATLTHTKNNRYCDSAVDRSTRSQWIIDLSHTSQKVQADALEISTAPVIFSHSACSSLVPHTRNVPDEILYKLKQNRGVLMICFLRDLVDLTGGQIATCTQVVDHIIYVGEKIGYEHVGIGSDFDGMLQGPERLDDVSCFPQLVMELLQRGVREADIEKVVGLNVLRVLKEVDEVAFRQRIADTVDVLCDEIPPMWTDEQVGMLRGQGAKRGLQQGSGESGNSV
ncbi:hypothetical protein BDW62DRAFT_220919 [Aspergillus aurantiobrunneus]